jgi:ABC-type multidrug transport system ATPase subunit
VIRIDGLTRILDGHRILDEVRITFARARLGLVTGPNGAGKTTLLRCLAGLEPFDSGRVLVGEQVVDTGTEIWRRDVALVPDDNALLSELTVADHLTLACVLGAVPVASWPDRVQPLLDLFGLATHRNRRMEQLSFGYRKRLAIAVSLVQPCAIHLFDEPLVGLDAASLELFVQVIRLLCARGRTVVVASHIAAPLSPIADATVTLRDGRVQMEEAPEDGPRAGFPDLTWLE